MAAERKWESMQLGTYIDGRALSYNETTGMFLVGEAPVTSDQVRAYEAAGQLTWAQPDIAEWFHRSFPVAPASAGKPRNPALVAIIVVAVLVMLMFCCGILTAIAVPVFNAAKINAEKKSCYANERTIEGAALTYQADSDELPASIEALVPTYIKENPMCPVAGPYEYDPEIGAAECVDHGHY